MTKVDFYTRVDDKLRVLSVLCGKALSRKTRVWISAPDEAVALTLDRSLWAVSAIAFLPHCLAHSALAPETPIVIGWSGAAPSHDQLLINYCDDQPVYFSRFERLIEMVSSEESDAERARQRYRFYQDRGYAIQVHDLSKTGETSRRNAD